MHIHDLYPFEPERKNKKRVGRGGSSGWGRNSGKGDKGQNCRAGGGVPHWFEGGQMPLQRRIPKRGFKNQFKVTYKVFNLDQIEQLFPEQNDISLDDFYKQGLCKYGEPIKILGQGNIGRKNITAHRFSASASRKITEAGGTASQVEG